MPATYSSPGVYVEEVPPMSRPISGVSTSTPGFVGIIGDFIALPYTEGETLKWLKRKPGAEAGKPYRISSWSNYVELFGDFVGTKYVEEARAAGVAAAAAAKLATKETESTKIEAEVAKAVAAATETVLAGGNAAEAKAAGAAAKAKETGSGSVKSEISTHQRNLAHAVFGFFNNGGTNCYVVRVAEAGGIVDALSALEPFDDISTVSFPGQADPQGNLAAHATKLQRFAILDLQEKVDPTKIVKPASSTYAGAYFPWLKVFDPAEAMINKNDGIVAVPPSGHIAGIYARSDAARGAYKAPANEALLGVGGLTADVSKAQQDILNVAGINAIRQLNGALRVWGARTIGTDNGEYRYISTRRYFNYLRQSIDSGTQFVVFEPHTPALWQRVIRTLTDFLTNEWRAGALFGETAKQAFFIKCDAETNPGSSREQGQLIVEIGVAIVKPAEFVIFRIQQNSGS